MNKFMMLMKDSRHGIQEVVGSIPSSSTTMISMG